MRFKPREGRNKREAAPASATKACSASRTEFKISYVQRSNTSTKVKNEGKVLLSNQMDLLIV